MQTQLFCGFRDDDPTLYKIALNQGANINVRLDKWRQSDVWGWGLKVPLYIGSLYTGFNNREFWPAPPGVAVDKNDTILHALIKCGRHDAVQWLLRESGARVDFSPNDAGNTPYHLLQLNEMEYLLPSGETAVEVPRPPGMTIIQAEHVHAGGFATSDEAVPVIEAVVVDTHASAPPQQAQYHRQEGLMHPNVNTLF